MKKFLCVCAVMLATSVSQAGIMLEPYLGYEMGKVSSTVAGGGDLSADPKGTTLGLRLAYSLPLLWVGLDGAISNGKYNPSAGTNEDVKKTTYSVVAGLEFPILLRAWVGYGFSNKMSIGNLDDLTGTSTKMGVGFTAFPLISLNFEYIKDDMKKIGSSDINTAFSKYDSHSYLLSVSLPLDF